MLRYRLLVFKFFLKIQKKCNFLSIILKNFLGPLYFVINFILVFQRWPKQTRILATKKSGRVDLLSENTSCIFLARCQLSDLEPAWSETAGSKFSLSSDCRKYKNFNQSGNFLDSPCINVCSIYVGHPINSRTDFM